MPSLSLLGFASLFYATLLPLVLLVFVGLLFVPCLLHTRNASAGDIGKAIVSYLFMSIGTVLILSGSIPWAFSLVSLQPASKESAFTFLVLLGTGIATVLLSRRAMRNIPDAAREVPHAITVTSFLTAGLLLILLGILLLLLSGANQETSSLLPWWIAPILLFAVGVILSLIFSRGARKDGKSLLRRLKLIK